MYLGFGTDKLVTAYCLLLALFILQSFMNSKLKTPPASRKINSTCDIIFYMDASLIVSQFELRMVVRKSSVRVNILIVLL